MRSCHFQLHGRTLRALFQVKSSRQREEREREAGRQAGTQLTETEHRLVVAGQGRGRRSQKVQTPSYKINKSWQHGDSN